MAYNSLMTDFVAKGEEITDQKFEDELNKNRGNNDVSVESDESSYIVYFSNTKHTYLVDKDGNISLIDNIDDVQHIEPTEKIYVTLYGDRTLAFSNNDSTDSTKTVSKKYTIEKDDTFYNNEEDDIPWKNERSQIKYVDFVNEVIPTTTQIWFWNCVNLEEIRNIENLNTREVTTMMSMFSECSNLRNLDVSHFNTRCVTDMWSMFWGCSKLENLDVSHFDTRNVKNMWAMFCKCSKLESLNLSHFDTRNVVNMEAMFGDCSNITSLDLRSFDTRNVTNMKYMFNMDEGTNPKLEEIKFGDKWNTSKVEDMRNMFWGNISLKSLDLSKFDTSNVILMSDMMPRLYSIETLDLSSFDTSKVTSMRYMVADCINLKSVNVSSFDTSNVTDMEGMFQGCRKLQNLDLSSFDTKNVINMEGMFRSYSIYDGNYNSGNGFERIYVGNGWDTDKVTRSSDMFSGCTNLSGGHGTKYNASYKDKTYAKVDNDSQVGYLIHIDANKLNNNEELEYLEFSSMRYINTGIIPSNHTIEIKFDFDTYYNNEHLFGTDSGWQYYSFTAYENKYYWGQDGSDSSNGGSWSTGEHTLIYNNGSNHQVLLDGAELGSGTDLFSTTNLKLGYRTNENANFAGKIYYVKITDKSTGELVRDFIPVHNKITDSAGLYDKVTGEFYFNNGLGTFTEGPRVNS